MQIDQEGLDHIYVCGDVADTEEKNPSGRSAAFQATIVAENVIQATEGRPPRHEYKSLGKGGIIQLTLGLVSNGYSQCNISAN
jgi:NADH dehydrogenase FAD-containing subunit